MANKVMMALLGGIGGAAGEYNKITDEQRKYNMSQKNAQAELDRKKHFEQFSYDLNVERDATQHQQKLEEQKALSGLRKEETKESNIQQAELRKTEKLSQYVDVTDPNNKVQLTQAEWEEARKDPNRKLMSVTSYQESETDKKTQEGKTTKYSLEVDPETNKRLTIAEAEKFVKEGKATKPYQEYLNEQKEAAQSIKDDKTFKNTFRKHVSKAYGSAMGGAVEKFQAMEEGIEIFGADERILEEPSVQSHNKMKGIMKKLLEFKEGGKGSFNDAIKQLGFTKKELKDAKAILQAQGHDMTKGLGW